MAEHEPQLLQGLPVELESERLRIEAIRHQAIADSYQRRADRAHRSIHTIVSPFGGMIDAAQFIYLSYRASKNSQLASNERYQAEECADVVSEAHRTLGLSPS